MSVPSSVIVRSRVAVALAATGMLAACSGGTSNQGAAAPSISAVPSVTVAPTAGGGGGGGSASAAPATVTTANSRLGPILVDRAGRTLYLFEKDKPNQSACSGACEAVWPPYRTGGTPTPGGGVHTSMLGTIQRGDHTTQVTYNGHPLYHYVGDTGSGQLHGQNVDNFGAEWYVVGPAGGAVRHAGS